MGNTLRFRSFLEINARNFFCFSPHLPQSSVTKFCCIVCPLHFKQKAVQQNSHRITEANLDHFSLPLSILAL